MKNILKLSLVLGFVLAFFYVKNAMAAVPVCFCHNYKTTKQTVCTTSQSVINQHKAHVRSGADRNGSCPAPTAVPTATTAPIATPTEEPTLTPTEVPTAIPTQEVTPTIEPKDPDAGKGKPPTVLGSTTEAPGACIPRSMGIIPTVWQVGVIDTDSVFVRWTGVEDFISEYVVWYGLYSGDYRWNGFFKGNYAELNLLPTTKIWVAVQATDNCGVGPLSTWIDP